MIDKAIITFRNDIDGDGSVEPGVFEIETNVEMEKQIRTSFALNNTADRVLGAVNFGNDDATKRSGITVDTGGGQASHQLSFTEADGGTNQWGDGSGNDFSDATGDSARRKVEVLERYIKTGTYGSANPAELQFGEYHPAGEYENFIPVAVQDIRVTVTAEGESSVQGRINLIEVGTLGSGASNTRDNFY